MTASPDAVMRQWFTGRAIDLWGTTIGRVENGQIVEGWNCFDFLTMYQQIGWVKSPVVG